MDGRQHKDRLIGHMSRLITEVLDLFTYYDNYLCSLQEENPIPPSEKLQAMADTQYQKCFKKIEDIKQDLRDNFNAKARPD